MNKNRMRVSAVVVVLAIAAFVLISKFSGFENEIPAKERMLEAQVQLSEIVDRVLAQDRLDVDLVNLKYNPALKLKNVYGFLKSCHPHSQNLNLIETSRIKEPKAQFTWERVITKKKDLIQFFFEKSPCLSKDEVRVYAISVDKDDRVVGWSMNLTKKMEAYELAP